MSGKSTTMVALETITAKMYFPRGQQVLLDSDLPQIYGVSTSALNQALKRRNAERFPFDFAFQLTRQELTVLISKFVISKQGRGGRHGAIKTLFDAIRELLKPTSTDQSRREIGFHVKERYRISRQKRNHAQHA